MVNSLKTMIKFSAALVFGMAAVGGGAIAARDGPPAAADEVRAAAAMICEAEDFSALEALIVADPERVATITTDAACVCLGRSAQIAGLAARLVPEAAGDILDSITTAGCGEADEILATMAGDLGELAPAAGPPAAGPEPGLPVPNTPAAVSETAEVPSITSASPTGP